MKTCKFVLIAIFLLGLSALAAEGWELDSDIMMNLTQSAFSDNWAGTELSNITWTAASNTVAQKQLKDWLHNKNTLKLAFGQTHMQKTDILGDKYWEEPEKSTDKIDLEGLFRFTLDQWVDPYAAVRMESQFLDEAGAETYFVNPMLFTESAGIMKNLIDLEATKLSIRLGGAVRENYNRRLDEVPVDGGLEGVAEFKHVFSMINASYNSKLWAYKALFNSKSDEMNDDWKAADFTWENMLSTKLWGLVSANVSLDFLYDKELSSDVRWKEVIGLGLSYTLF